MEQTGVQSTPLRRQAEEGTRILEEIALRDKLASTIVERRDGEEKNAIVMNSRREFYQPLGGIIAKAAYL